MTARGHSRSHCSDRKWVLSTFYHPDYGAFACLFPYEEEQKLRTIPSPAKWLLRPAVPPGRLQLPGAPNDSSGYFRLYNPYHPRYLADYATLSSRRKCVETIPAHAGFALPDGGIVWVPDRDVTREDSGPDFRRTMLREPANLASVFGSDGKINLEAEKNQQSSYKQQCWLIEDRVEPPTWEKFPQLQHDYIQQWIKVHEAGD